MILSILLVIIVVGLIVVLAVSLASKKKLASKCNHLESDLKAKTEEADGVVSSNGQLEEQVAGLELSIKELGDAVANRDDNVKCLLEKQSIAENQIVEYEKEIKRLYDIISSNDATITELKTKEAKLQEDISVKNEKQKDSDDQVKELEEEVGRLADIISTKDEVYAQLESKEADLQEKIIAAYKDVGSKDEDITRLQSELDELKIQVADKSKKLAQYESELAASNESVETLKAQIEELKQQDDESGSEEGKEFDADELERTIVQLQKANEDLSQCRSELATKNILLEIRRQKIEDLQLELSKAKEEIRRLKEEIDALKGLELITAGCEGEVEDTLPDSNEDQTDEEVYSRLEASDNGGRNKLQGGKRGYKSPDSMRKEKDEDDDLPLVRIDNGVVHRSILYVRDLESSNPEEKIYADEFFSRDVAEIISKTYYLNEADKRGRDAFVCGCCGKPVKISKHDFGTDVYFFKHCKKDVSCVWQKECFGSFGGDPGTELDEGELQRYNEVKTCILNSLRTKQSQEKGVCDVEEYAVLRGKHPFMVWRRAGVCARYGYKNLVFELVTRNTHLNYLTDKDLFCRINDFHVIWILGTDVRDGYDYIRKFVPQNTMFANRRNVFFVDDDTLTECEKRQELVLKCNYLDPDDHWHYRKDTSGNNGQFVTLDQLQYDDDLCKPYFFDANPGYFAIHPEAAAKFAQSYKSKDEIIEDLRKKYEERKRVNHIDEENKNEEPKPVIKPVPCRENRFFYRLNGKWGLVDKNQNFILPCEYDKIALWATNKYKVLKVDLWGVFEEDKGFVLDFRFLNIDGFKNNRALVDTGTEQYLIDRNLHRVYDERITLQNGWVKYRLGDKWGIVDKDGNEVLKCQYDEIGSFRGRLIGFINGSFQKLPQRFNYRLMIQCKCLRNENQHAVFAINGVELHYLIKKICKDGALYKDKCIANILHPSGHIIVKDFTNNDIKKHFLILADDNSDFEMDKFYCGEITSKRQKRYYVRLFDGKRTMFNLKAIVDAGKDPNDFGIGTVVTLKKRGFDKNYDRTIWQIV